jgi:hypothetical protein
MAIRNKLTYAAEAYLGTPYVLGGSTKAGIDCSGLVMVAAKAAYDITLPHYTYAMVSDPHLRSVARKDVLRGDLLFFHNNAHVAIYIGKPVEIGGEAVLDAEGHEETFNGKVINGGTYRRPMAPGYYVDWANVNAICRFRLPFWQRFEVVR